MTKPETADALAALKTLLIGALGAGFFTLINFPAAVLTGSAFAVSMASLCGIKTRIPTRLRDICFIVLGISIGSTVTPEVVAGAKAWPISLATLVVVLLATLFGLRALLQRMFRFDRMTALLAATPGHMSYIVGMSSTLNVDLPVVALAQAVRVLLLTLLVPLVIGLSGAVGEGPSEAVKTLALLPMLALFAAAFLAGEALKRVAVPAALLIGGIFVSAVGHATDVTPGALPFWLIGAAFVTMGSLIGTRFNGVRGPSVVKGLAAGVLGTVVACLFAGLGAFAGYHLLGLPPAALLLAFAPGGVEVMAALAVETGLEPAFVAAHHVFRLMVLTVAVPLLVRSTQT